MSERCNWSGHEYPSDNMGSRRTLGRGGMPESDPIPANEQTIAMQAAAGVPGRRVV